MKKRVRSRVSGVKDKLEHKRRIPGRKRRNLVKEEGVHERVSGLEVFPRGPGKP